MESLENVITTLSMSCLAAISKAYQGKPIVLQYNRDIRFDLMMRVAAGLRQRYRIH
jgi:hypothetical protein